MQMTHKQWLFRNAHVHYKKLEGLTMSDHERIYDRVLELRLTDPASLLDQHQYLLDADFLELGEGPTLHRQGWIASVESALASANFVSSGLPTRGYHPPPSHTEHPHTSRPHTPIHPLATASHRTRPTTWYDPHVRMPRRLSPSGTRPPDSHRTSC